MGRILLVEDEVMVLALLEDALLLQAHHVYTARRLEEAKALASVLELDAALVDVNVIHGKSWEVADVLTARGVPFVFMSGWAPSRLEVPERHHSVPFITKPFRLADIVTIIRALITNGGIGKSGELSQQSA